MSTLDVVAYAGEEFIGEERHVKPANFLDIGGGASAQVMANGLEIILGDLDVKSVFVNVFGGITACDEVANGIVQALEPARGRQREVSHPLVVRLDGNNAELGRQILTDANHPLVQRVDTMDGAADKARRTRCHEVTTQKKHGYLAQQGQQGHRPGHDRCHGHEAHQAHAGRRHPGSWAA